MTTNQLSLNLPLPITNEERRALAALEICYGLVTDLAAKFGIDDATLVRFGKQHFNLPGSSATIGAILDEADEVLGAAKERGK